MLDLSKYQSIGGALKDAVEVFANETCLIEADRERENHRLTYREFRDRAMPVAKALQDAGFSAGDRAAIIMTNQSKWLIAAYAIFYSGGVLVPLDYKLTADEQWQLLKHSGARVLITEYPIWRQLSVATGREAPPNSKWSSLPKPRSIRICSAACAGKILQQHSLASRNFGRARAAMPPPLCIPREPAAGRKAA